MRLEVTRRAGLAVKAMALLTRVGDRVKGPELAVAVGTTSGFLPQVVGPLVRAGWVVSDPGPTGGYRRAEGVDEPSVLDVIEAVDGPTELGMCVTSDAPCSEAEQCALHMAWSSARDALLADLSAMPITNAYTGMPGRAADPTASNRDVRRKR